MKFSIEKTYNLQNRLESEKFAFENLRLSVSEADSPEEAEKELVDWATKHIMDLKKKLHGDSSNN